MYDIAIILPAYNEENTIAETIQDFFSVLPDAYIVVIDNASTDNTRAAAEHKLSELAATGHVIHEPRPGKGNAIRAGFQSIEANIYIMADTDMTYSAADAHQLIRPLREDNIDMVVGDRLSGGDYKSENKRAFHNFGNSLVCWLVNSLFRANLRDIMSGYRAISRRFVTNYPILVEGFQLETDMTLYALDKRFSIVEVPVKYRDRPSGSISKLNTYKDGSRVLLTIVTIFRHYRPLVFFGTLAILVACSSLLAATPVIGDWITHRYIYHVPLAILASGLALLSSLFFALALILDSIAYQHRLNFEREAQSSVRKHDLKESGEQ